MSEQLYRWVKASEPPKKESYFKGRRIGEDRERILLWDEENWFVIYNGSEVKIPKSDIKYYEYQADEPLPSPGDNQSLEEAAKNHCKNNYDPTLSGWESAVPFFLAGAAYVKGGGEKRKLQFMGKGLADVMDAAHNAAIKEAQIIVGQNLIPRHSVVEPIIKGILEKLEVIKRQSTLPSQSPSSIEESGLKEGEGKNLGTCVECKKRKAVRDYNGHRHYVCNQCYDSLSNEFEDEYR